MYKDVPLSAHFYGKHPKGAGHMSDKSPEKTQKNNPVRYAETLQKQSKTACSDVLGSYTGTAADDDVPEQDADDL